MIVMIPGSFNIFIGQNLKVQNTLVFRDFWHLIICVHVHVYVRFHVNGLYVKVRGLVQFGSPYHVGSVGLLRLVTKLWWQVSLHYGAILLSPH